jgi:hypothetical protein
MRKFAHDHFNIKIRSKTRFRQRWLSLFALGESVARDRVVRARRLIRSRMRDDCRIIRLARSEEHRTG